jgi:hypothetical protein
MNILMEKTMKYKVGQKVECYCDLNDKAYHGTVKMLNPIDETYLVAFSGGRFWVHENQLEEVL